LNFNCPAGKKETTGNIKSVNKPATSPLVTEKSAIKEQVERKGDECHQRIVKRLMSHSQYFPPSNVIKVEAPPVVTAPVMSYHHAPYTVSHVYNNNNNVGDFYQKDFGYQQNYQQQPPPYSSLTLTPPLASPTIIHNFDQLSNCSPPSSAAANTSDYIFNGDFGIFSSSDFDLSFPFVDSTIAGTAVKSSSQLFDNQTVEIKQLTPIKIQSLDDDDVEKKSFELASDDHDAIPALPSVASVNCWKFTEPQMAASY
jgi:hypothetical protein